MAEQYQSKRALIDALHARYVRKFKLRRGVPRTVATILFEELRQAEGGDPSSPRGYTIRELHDRVAADRYGEFPTLRAVEDAVRSLAANLRDFRAEIAESPVQIGGQVVTVRLSGPEVDAREGADPDRYSLAIAYEAVREKAAEPPTARIGHDARLDATETLLLAVLDDVGRSELRDRARELFDEAREGPSLDRYIDGEMVALLRDVEDSIATDVLTAEHRQALWNAMFQAEAEYLEIVAAAEKNIGTGVMATLSALEKQRLRKYLSAQCGQAWRLIFTLAVVWAWELGGEQRPSFPSVLSELRKGLPESVRSPYFQRILDTVRVALTQEGSSEPPQTSTS